MSVTAATAPRYAQVARDLIERIAAGQYPVGSILPKETDLSLEYGISRHTMREALRRVREAGLVSPRRRAGTEVVARTPATSYQQPINSITDILQYGSETEMRIVRMRRVRADAALAELLRCAPDREWLRLETLRRRPGERGPLCHTTMYVTTELPDIKARLRGATAPISSVLEATYGLRIAVIEQGIEAVPLPAREARLLRAEPGAPALRAVRRFYDDGGRLLELSLALHPAGRFTYVTRMTRNRTV